ncbi:MAG: sensor histidine kinase [Anaerolineales bacterium]|nr:MAG: sensor histidine kinase [Anaerolineales bacterium]
MPASSTAHPKKTILPRREAWERWVSVWHVVFYVSLALPTILALSSADLERPGWQVLGLSLGLGLLYGLIMVWAAPRARENPRLALIWTVIYLVAAIVLWFPLARTHPSYYLTASSFYGLMWGTLPFGLALVGNIFLTGLIIWSQALNSGEPVVFSFTSALIGVAAISWSTLLALWMRTVMRESVARKRLIEQLEATQNDLATAERQAGILQERQRLAQEIHDTLAQGFTSIVMQLEAADQALPEGTDAVRGHIQQAGETARLSLVEARRLVMALQPRPLEEASLPEALRRVAHRWEEVHGVKMAFTVTGDPYSLHPDVEVTLLRAMQEALTNVHKHAQASEVSVTLSYMDDQVALDIHDNGIGFDPGVFAQPAGNLAGGFGLHSMRQRVAQFGGEIILENAPLGGATLAVQIPLTQATQEGSRKPLSVEDRM